MKEQDEDRFTEYDIHVSYVEIYNEEIRDLLSGNPLKKLEIKGNHGTVEGITLLNRHISRISTFV